MHILTSRKCAPAAVVVVVRQHSSEALSSVLGGSAWQRAPPAFPFLSEVLFFLLKWLSSSPHFQQTSCIFIAIWRIPTGLNKGGSPLKTAYWGDKLEKSTPLVLATPNVVSVCMSFICLWSCVCAVVYLAQKNTLNSEKRKISSGSLRINAENIQINAVLIYWWKCQYSMSELKPL